MIGRIFVIISNLNVASVEKNHLVTGNLYALDAISVDEGT